MIKKLKFILQISFVFIGTIVGAGLASGQEITQFFSTYGFNSFIGIFLCAILYISTGYIIISLSIKYKLNSYTQLIKLVSPGFLGNVTDILTSLFLISSSAIILAGSGALINQYFKINKWFGISLMVIMSIVILFKNTKGLIQINSLIVPSLTIVILTIFALYIFSSQGVNIEYVKNIPHYKNNWLISSLLYGSFNILCCSGVLVPFSNELKNKKFMVLGVIIGSILLTILSSIINLLLILNIPYIFEYEVPLLYVSNRFGIVIQIMLLTIIWCEMFSTEVSDIYSVSKTINQTFKISYNKCCIIILIITIPISQIGFVNLITFLYPAFGLISLIFILQCFIFYIKNRKKI